MNYTTYQSLARRTESTGVELHEDGLEMFVRLAHAQWGLTTEIVEFKFADDDANKNEELGDILWYFDLACHVMGWNIGQIDPKRFKDLDKTELMEYGLGEFTDLLKRRYFYGTNNPNFKFNLAFALGMILAGLTDIVIEEGFEMHDILDKNIEKLKIRQPGKFSGEASVNRDLQKERAVFE